MSFLLYLGSIIAFLFGLILFWGANGAIHQIAGLVSMLIGAVLLAGGAVNSSINRSGNRICDTLVATRKEPAELPATTEQPELESIPEPSPPVAKSWVEVAKEEIQQGRA